MLWQIQIMASQIKNGGCLVCAGKRQNGGRIRFPTPLPCVVAKLLIFEGKGWVQIKIVGRER